MILDQAYHPIYVEVMLVARMMISAQVFRVRKEKLKSTKTVLRRRQKKIIPQMKTLAQRFRDQQSRKVISRVKNYGSGALCNTLSDKMIVI